MPRQSDNLISNVSLCSLWVQHKIQVNQSIVLI